MNLKDLVGKDLSSFKIIEMTEVFMVNSERFKTRSVGFFESSDLAKAFVGPQTNENFFKTETALVLTDGNVGFAFDINNEEINLFDAVVELPRIKERILVRLLPEERKILEC